MLFATLHSYIHFSLSSGKLTLNSFSQHVPQKCSFILQNLFSYHVEGNLALQYAILSSNFPNLQLLTFPLTS